MQTKKVTTNKPKSPPRTVKKDLKVPTKDVKVQNTAPLQKDAEIKNPQVNTRPARRPRPKSTKSSDLLLRTLTAAIVLPAGLAILLIGGIVLKITLILLGCVGAIEGYRIVKNKRKHWYLTSAIVSLTVITTVACASLISDINKYYLLILCISIWSIDISAYFFGRWIAGRKLVPNISPNKTISGLICGVVTSAFVTQGFCYLLSSLNLIPAHDYARLSYTLLFAIFALLAQAGDILESKFKRTYGVKDSGKIFPGHGGVLDRFDGFYLPLVLWTVMYFGGAAKYLF